MAKRYSEERTASLRVLQRERADSAARAEAQANAEDAAVPGDFSADPAAAASPQRLGEFMSAHDGDISWDGEEPLHRQLSRLNMW